MRNLINHLSAGLILIASVSFPLQSGLSQTSSGRALLAFEAVSQVWQLKTGDETRYAGEASLPFYLFLNVHPRSQIRLSGAGASYVSFQQYDTPLGKSDSTSTLSGLTNFKLESDFAISNRILVGLNAGLPTGQTSLTDEEERAVALFVRPELASRMPRPGSGMDLGGQLAFAQPLTSHWLAAASAGIQSRGAYTAKEDAGEVDPGDEMLASLAIDYGAPRFSARAGAILTTFSAEQYNGEDHFQSGDKIEYKLGLNARTGLANWSASIRHIERSANSIGAELKTESKNSNSPFTMARLAVELALTPGFHLQPSLHSRRLGKNESDFGEGSILGGGLELIFPAPSSEVRLYLSGAVGEINDGETDVIGGAAGARMAFRL